ncbi:MAG: lipoprotein-releasing ABC transporter permease subunit [bacterium]|nr:lipoprotein-releasing ABC transporter permease subunit [bacterium]
MFYEGFIAWRYLKAKRRERFISFITLISILGVTIGVAALIIALGLMNGFTRDLREKILGTKAHIFVLNPGGSLSNHLELIKKIKKVSSDILGCSPNISGQAILSSGSEVMGVVIQGINPRYEKDVTELKNYIQKGTLDFRGDKEIVIGVELAKLLGVSLGDKVVLISPHKIKKTLITPFSLVPRTDSFRVGGLFSSGMYDYDASLCFVSLETAQRLFGLNQSVTGISVKIKDIFKAKEIAHKIQAYLGYSYWVRTWMEMNRNLFSAIRLEKVVTFIALSLIVFVGVFNILTTLIMSVMRKTKQIGILKSMGASSGSIQTIFIIEGLLIGILGTIFGFLFGILGCTLLSHYQFIKLPSDIYYISYLPIHLECKDLIYIGIATILLSLIATIYPARNAAKIQPVEAIRYE